MCLPLLSCVSMYNIAMWPNVHDQYTYNAERRSIYTQMMLNYLVEGCEIIAASDVRAIVRRCRIRMHSWR